MDIEQTIRQYLSEVIHLSLGTSSKDGKPWVCELHFAYDDNLNLYFRSTPARRHSQEIAANPNVAGNVIKQHHPKDNVLGVYFEGTAKKLEPGEEQTDAYNCINNRFGRGPEILDEAKNPQGHQFYKIAVENWYVFGDLNDGQGNQKHQLAWQGHNK